MARFTFSDTLLLSIRLRIAWSEPFLAIINFIFSYFGLLAKQAKILSSPSLASNE